MLCNIKMNLLPLALLVVVILTIIRVFTLKTEEYTRALDGEYVGTRNSRRVADFFHVCSPSSGGCDRGTLPVKGLPIA